MTKYHDIIHTALSAAHEVAHRVRRNPVLVGGAAVAAYSSLSSGHLTVDSVVTVAVAFLVRSQVVPAGEVVLIEHSVEDFIERLVKDATPPAT